MTTAATRTSSIVKGAIAPAVLLIAVPIGIGIAIAAGQAIVIAVALAGIGAIALIPRLDLTKWCVLLLVATVVVRLPVQVLGLPAALNFVHYPLALAFAVAAARRPKPERRPPGSPATWMAVIVLLAVASLLVNLAHPLRAVLFLGIVGEPLLVVWSIWRWDVDAVDFRRIGRWAAAILAIQVPLGLFQGLTVGWSDHVQGTLLGQGAGQHILGGLFALALFVCVAAMMNRRLAMGRGVLICGVCFFMVLATQALQVALAMTVALVMLVLVAARRRDATAMGGRSAAVTVVVAILVAALAPVLAEALVPGLLKRATSYLNFQRLPELQLVTNQADQGLTQLAFGSGPGTTGSRASILLTERMMKPGSPLEALGLRPTAEGIRVVNSSRTGVTCGGCPGGGSAEAYASTVYGIQGDLGFLGTFALIGLFVALWRGVGRGGGWLAPAAQAALVMTGVLIWIDNWLEYPEYSVPLVILIAAALVQRTAENDGSSVEQLAGRPRRVVGVGSPQL